MGDDSSMKRLLIGLVLTSLLTLLFAAGAVHASADTPYSVTYYFQPAPSYGGCSDGVGSLTTTPYNIWSTVEVGGACPGDTMNTTYTGPDLVDVSYTFNMTSSCGKMATVGITTNLLGYTSGWPCDGIGTNSYTTTPIYTIGTGQPVIVYVGFGQEVWNITGGHFIGSMTINGIDPPTPTGVPQFPLGMLPLLAVCVPVLLVLRRRATR